MQAKHYSRECNYPLPVRPNSIQGNLAKLLNHLNQFLI